MGRGLRASIGDLTIRRGSGVCKISVEGRRVSGLGVLEFGIQKHSLASSRGRGTPSEKSKSLTTGYSCAPCTTNRQRPATRDHITTSNTCALHLVALTTINDTKIYMQEPNSITKSYKTRIQFSQRSGQKAPDTTFRISDPTPAAQNSKGPNPETPISLNKEYTLNYKRIPNMI